VTSRTDIVEAFAPAKINLFLHVGEKREDGFHELESLVVFVEAGDALSFKPSDALTLTLDGPFAAGLLTGGDNLVLRAARALATHAGLDDERFGVDSIQLGFDSDLMQILLNPVGEPGKDRRVDLDPHLGFETLWKAGLA